MEITMIGLDLAKSVFQAHGVDASGKAVLRRKLQRAEVLAFFGGLAPCLVGIEACGTAHYWAREIRALGHQVRLMPVSYVKPYVKRGKTDAAEPPRVFRRLLVLPGWSHDEASRPFSPEVRARAVRMALAPQGGHGVQPAAIRSMAERVGCSGETLRRWVRQAERDRGVRAGPSADERGRLRALRPVSERLRQASA